MALGPYWCCLSAPISPEFRSSQAESGCHVRHRPHAPAPNTCPIVQIMFSQCLEYLEILDKSWSIGKSIGKSPLGNVMTAMVHAMVSAMTAIGKALHLQWGKRSLRPPSIQGRSILGETRLPADPCTCSHLHYVAYIWPTYVLHMAYIWPIYIWPIHGLYVSPTYDPDTSLAIGPWTKFFEFRLFRWIGPGAVIGRFSAAYKLENAVSWCLRDNDQLTIGFHSL